MVISQLKGFALGISLGMILLAGCATRRQVEGIEKRLDNLERSSASIENKVTLLDSLYRAQDEAQTAFLARLEASIAAFEERLGQLGYQLTDLNDRMGRLEIKGFTQSAPSTASPDSTKDTTGAGGKPQVDPGIIYSAALRNLQAGNYEIAILGFTEYINSFPNTDLTDDAQLWLGECYYQKDPPDYEKAKAEFDKVLKNYPQSDRKVNALFKLARCQEELKETKAAIRLYREILDKYPQTAEADRAKVQLKGLGEK